MTESGWLRQHSLVLANGSTNSWELGERPHVLVVDDDPDIRLTISLTLQQAGFRVSAFDDGQSALDNATEIPALILLDYMMPRLGASGFMRVRHRNPCLATAPVVVISAYPDLVDVAVAETVGVLHKPIDLELLLECVHYHTGFPRLTEPRGA